MKKYLFILPVLASTFFSSCGVDEEEIANKVVDKLVDKYVNEVGGNSKDESEDEFNPEKYPAILTFQPMENGKPMYGYMYASLYKETISEISFNDTYTFATRKVLTDKKGKELTPVEYYYLSNTTFVQLSYIPIGKYTLVLYVNNDLENTAPSNGKFYYQSISVNYGNTFRTIDFSFDKAVWKQGL